ncbi:hypothetical protein AB4238_19035 [Shewanella sp. 10N.286.45.A1]|uniref:hypothetical protein n=1 Tax=Shewanella sp. 10N.286.45.A1 TaxID=3229694 RepID=UPI00355006AE
MKILDLKDLANVSGAGSTGPVGGTVCPPGTPPGTAPGAPSACPPGTAPGSCPSFPIEGPICPPGQDSSGDAPSGYPDGQPGLA